MYNVTTKPIRHVLLCGVLSAIALLTASCSNDNQTQRAQEMLSRARTAAESGQYAMAKMLLDSIDSVCPKAIDVRREGITLMVAVREGLINTQIAQTDSLLAVAQLRGDSLQRSLHKVDNPIEPYFAVSGLGTVTNGLDPRLMPDGTLYILSRLSSPKIRHTAISVSAPDGTSASTSSIPYDGERNDVVGGIETITFIGSDADTIGSFVNAHRDESLTLRFSGPNGKSTELTLPRNQTEAISAAYGYAANIRERKILNIRRRALEEQLGLNRTQSASLR